MADEHTSHLANEQLRMRELLQLMPAESQSVLEIGARDGRITRLLVERYPRVIALDLETPNLQLPNCELVKGNVCSLDYADNSIDFIVCTEVLEHVPDLEQACHELARVAAKYLLVGVPFRQDTRLARTTCASCGTINPPWGHVNEFDEPKLLKLFPDMKPKTISFVGEKKARTNTISTALMDFAGNPWGMYIQEEPCVRCGAKLIPPNGMTTVQRVAAALSYRLTLAQNIFTPKTPLWIHILFEKR